MAAFNAKRLIEKHGVVLAAGKGPVPNLAEAVAGEPIQGSWWGHPAGQRIFAALESLDDWPEVLCFRLIDGKITFVHRRLWPALVRLADKLGRDRLTAIRQVHTESGQHQNELTRFPDWASAAVLRAAESLDEASAIQLLGEWASQTPRARKKKRL